MKSCVEMMTYCNYMHTFVLVRIIFFWCVRALIMHMLHCFSPYASHIMFDPQASVLIYIFVGSCCAFLWCTVRTSHSSTMEFDAQYRWVTSLLVPVRHCLLLRLSSCTLLLLTCTILLVSWTHFSTLSYHRPSDLILCTLLHWEVLLFIFKFLQF